MNTFTAIAAFVVPAKYNINTFTAIAAFVIQAKYNIHTFTAIAAFVIKQRRETNTIGDTHLKVNLKIKWIDLRNTVKH